MKKISVLLSLVLLLSTVSGLSAAFTEESTYAETLFDQSRPIEIDIRMDDEAWNSMIANASSEEYSACDLVVNGVLYENVAIRPKGNSSLSSVANRGSERFSWRIKFDKYEKKRTCDGLDILILNNGFKDPGELREALAYDMYAFLDADASLYNYAVVYHNGEYFGCYLALEGVDKSFAKRNYGEDYGELYKPDMTGNADRNKADDDPDAADDDGFGGSFGGSRGTSAAENGFPSVPGQDAQTDGGENSFPSMPDQDGQSSGSANGAPSVPNQESQTGGAENSFPSMPAQDSQTEGSGAPRSSGREERSAAGGDSGFGGSFGGRASNGDGENRGMPQGFNFGAFNKGGGAKSDSQLAMALNYVGDDLDTYQEIWDSSKFKSDDEDHARVVEALKHVCQGDGISDYLDVDNVLKYFAIQTFIYNHDGLTGTASHNYYLYEENGRLNLVPWDMNEAFTVSGDGSDYVNFPIDTPFAVDDLSQRSFFMALLNDEECLAKYHEYLRQLSEEYALGGGLDAAIERIRAQIDALVETDPTAFSTYQEYVSSAESLETAIKLRAESVLGQISGEIPSTKEGQKAEPEKLLDTSGADLSGLTSGYGMGMNMMNFTMPQMPGIK